eukprot:3299990-Prymnesium_polylepis.1
MDEILGMFDDPLPAPSSLPPSSSYAASTAPLHPHTSAPEIGEGTVSLQSLLDPFYVAPARPAPAPAPMPTAAPPAPEPAPALEPAASSSSRIAAMDVETDDHGGDPSLARSGRPVQSFDAILNTYAASSIRAIDPSAGDRSAIAARKARGGRGGRGQAEGGRGGAAAPLRPSPAPRPKTAGGGGSKGGGSSGGGGRGAGSRAAGADGKGAAARERQGAGGGAADNDDEMLDVWEAAEAEAEEEEAEDLELDEYDEYDDDDDQWPKLSCAPHGPREDVALGPRPRRADGSLYSAEAVLPGSIAQHLRTYQREGVEWMWAQYAKDKGGILGDEMGLGKTVQVAAFLSAVLGKMAAAADKARRFPLPEGDARLAL